jgi:hypothetical protein
MLKKLHDWLFGDPMTEEQKEMAEEMPSATEFGVPVVRRTGEPPVKKAKR